MANGLVQQNARPTVAQRYVHHAGGGVAGLQINQRNAQGLAGGGLPVGGIQQQADLVAPAAAMAAGLAAAVFFNRDRNVKHGHRAHIAQNIALGAQDLDLLQ